MARALEPQEMDRIDDAVQIDQDGGPFRIDRAVSDRGVVEGKDDVWTAGRRVSGEFLHDPDDSDGRAGPGGDAGDVEDQPTTRAGGSMALRLTGACHRAHSDPQFRFAENLK